MPQFEWKGATISARPLTIADEEDIGLLMEKLKDAGAAGGRYRFAEFMIGAIVGTGTPPVPMVNVRSDPDAIRASYETWRTLPRAFGQKWGALMQEVETRAGE